VEVIVTHTSINMGIVERSLSDKILLLPFSSGKSYLILFIIWPFLAFIVALVNYAQKEARMVVFFFLVYFGLTFVADNEAMDSFGYLETFIFYSTLPFKEFFKVLSGYYSTGASMDFIEPTITFLLSRFTRNYHIFFAVFASLFAFFYLRSFNLLYDEYKKSPNWNAWIFMAFSLVVIPITSLSGLRMWIAAWMFFLGAYQVLLTRKPKYLLVALSACLMHWSFINLNLLLIVWYLAGNRNAIYTPLAIASFFLPQFLQPVLVWVAAFTGGGIAARVEGYTGESHSETYQEWLDSTAWFLQLNHDMIWYFFIAAIILIRVFKRDTVKGKLEENWYSFMLLMFTMVNFGRSIPDFGRRMQTVFILFASVYVFLYFRNLSEQRIRFITVAAAFPLLLYTFIEFRVAADSMSAWYLAPGLGLPLLDPGLSLAEVLF
jgi:hypothetical protein